MVISLPKIYLLQIFADGEGTGDNAPAAEVTEATAEAVANPQEDSEYQSFVEKYSSRIEEEYNKRYAAEKEKSQKDFQKALNARTRKANETIASYEQMQESFEILAQQYNVDVKDLKALNEAIINDDSRYEERAIETGQDVKTLREQDKMKRDYARMEQKLADYEQARQQQEIYNKLSVDADNLKGIYANFDLANELENPDFAALLKSGVTMRTAYEVVHKDELVPAAMNYAISRGAEKVAQSVAANGARPVENGNGGTSTAITKVDINNLSKEQMQDYIERARRGEIVTFQ